MVVVPINSSEYANMDLCMFTTIIILQMFDMAMLHISINLYDGGSN